MATIAEILSYGEGGLESDKDFFKYLTDLLHHQDSDIFSAFYDYSHSGGDAAKRKEINQRLSKFLDWTLGGESSMNTSESWGGLEHESIQDMDIEERDKAIGALKSFFSDYKDRRSITNLLTDSQTENLLDSLIAGKDLIADKVQDFNFQGQVGDVEASKERDIRDIQNAYATSELKNRYQRLTGQDLTSPSSSKTGRESYVDALAGIERGAESDIDKINRALKSSFYSGVEEWQNL